ncbi:MAG: hypothetical protein ABI691_22385 [Ginsengibacter sp.]
MENDSNKQLMRYAGLGMQFLIAIALGVFLGLKADGWLKISIPLLVWLFPLIIISAIIFKLIKETSTKK